jgi:hypothetical protein
MQPWWNFFVSWLPFLLLLAFWVFFMKKVRMSRQAELIDRTFEHQVRVEALLERIAVSLERQA